MALLLNDDQRKVLADIGIVAGQITAGSMVLPFLIPRLDDTKVIVLISGLVLTLSRWSFSMWIVRKDNL